MCNVCVYLGNLVGSAAFTIHCFMFALAMYFGPGRLGIEILGYEQQHRLAHTSPLLHHLTTNYTLTLHYNHTASIHCILLLTLYDCYTSCY